jgi:alkylated DNA repair protein (DNA oxidative demethylase)
MHLSAELELITIKSGGNNMPASTYESDADRPPPGVHMAFEVIAPNQEMQLIQLIDACRPQTYPGDEKGGLSAISFGWRYEFSNGEFSPCAPMPEGFIAIRNIAAQFASLRPESFVQCLLNRYERGADIAWHIDKPVWEHVVGISLGAPGIMRFRKEASGDYEFGAITLLPRSIYFLSGEGRHAFAHSVLPVVERRWSITFRTFSVEGERMCAAFRTSD